MTMSMLNAHDLTHLAEGRGGTRISLFLPTHRGGPQLVRNRIRLKNLLRHSERALLADGMRAGHVEALLEPARQLLDVMPVWDQPSDGLALFIGPEGFRHVRVPLRLPELVTVGDRFVVRPLLPLLIAGGHFYVLALNQDEIRLFEGTRFGLEEVALVGFPLAVWLTMPRRQPQVHAYTADRGGVGGRAVFHGGAEVDVDVRVVQHFQRVDQSLRHGLLDEGPPLVLAGVRHLQALYHKANTYPHLLTTGVDGNPDDMSTEFLHRRAWALVEPVLRGQELGAAAAHRALQGTGRTSNEPATVLTAAQQGRVEALFLSTDGTDWQTSANATPLIRLGDTPDPGEQLGLAAVATLRHGGQVYAVPASRMPDVHPVAATLRF